MKTRSFLAIAALALLASCTGTPEVNYKVWYDWPERYVPDFATLGEPDVQGVKENIDLVDIDDTRNHFCVLFETELKVAKEEEYNFTLTTDDGSKLYIDGEMLIENDGAHGPIEKKVSKVLSKGKHPLKIEFFDYDKGQSIVFRYSTPTIKDREFNDKVMFRDDKLTSKDGFVKPQVTETYERFKEWKGDDEAVVFPILTDVHTAGRFTYKHESIYNTYSENVFTLDRRLFGVHTITIAFTYDLYLHGFYFEKSPKAFAKLAALDADLIAGDSFTKTDTAVEKIGNNVNLDFANMDFGDTTTTKLTICGKSNTENNTINIKFFAADGTSQTQVIEFAHTDDYEEKTFEITPVTGSLKISFVFLPGCNFDFKWFRFR